MERYAITEIPHGSRWYSGEGIDCVSVGKQTSRIQQDRISLEISGMTLY